MSVATWQRLCLTALVLSIAGIPARATVLIRVANAGSTAWFLVPEGIRTFGSISYGKWPGAADGDPRALLSPPLGDEVRLDPGTIVEMAWNDQAQPWGAIRIRLRDRFGRNGCGASLAVDWGPGPKRGDPGLQSRQLLFQPKAGEADPGTLEAIGEWSKDGGTFILRADAFRFRATGAGATPPSSVSAGSAPASASSAPVDLPAGSSASRKRKREDSSSGSVSSSSGSSSSASSSSGSSDSSSSDSDRPAKRPRIRLEQDTGGSSPSVATEERKQPAPAAGAGIEGPEPDPDRPGKVEPLVIRNDSDADWQFSAAKLPRSFLVEFRWAPGHRDLKDQGLHQGADGRVVIPHGETAYLSPAAPADASGLVFELPFTLAPLGRLGVQGDPVSFRCTFDHLTATLGKGRDGLGNSDDTLGLEIRIQGKHTIWLPPLATSLLPIWGKPKF